MCIESESSNSRKNSLQQREINLRCQEGYTWCGWGSGERTNRSCIRAVRRKTNSGEMCVEVKSRRTPWQGELTRTRSSEYLSQDIHTWWYH